MPKALGVVLDPKAEVVLLKAEVAPNADPCAGAVGGAAGDGVIVEPNEVEPNVEAGLDGAPKAEVPKALPPLAGWDGWPKAEVVPPKALVVAAGRDGVPKAV